MDIWAISTFIITLQNSNMNEEPAQVPQVPPQPDNSNQQSNRRKPKQEQKKPRIPPLQA